MASPHDNRGFHNRSSCFLCADSNHRERKVAVPSSFTSRYPNKDGDSSDAMHEMKRTEDVLAAELSKLSVQERSEAYDDVHCVGDELQETPEMIQKSLLEFNQAIPKHRNAAYDIALKQNKGYVEDPSFRLKFLRAKMHNVNLAVHQMMKFLRYKGEYFGEDKLGRDITFADLTEEEIKIMTSGIFHIQAERDRMGRVVFYWLSSLMGSFKRELIFRVTFYVRYNILSILPEVAMKGIVEIFLGVPRPRERAPISASEMSVQKMLDAGSSLPCRKSAGHYCLADNGSGGLENALVAAYVRGLWLYTRVRARIHYGTMMELKYKLAGHGIPTDTFPVDMNGNVREDIINAWFFDHQAQENRKAKAATVETPKLARRSEPPVASITPSENDVLSGRGRFSQEHLGNVRFRKFVADHSDEYDRLDRHSRMIFTIKVMQEFSSKNVRFLKKAANGAWVILDGAEARMKVSQQFRSFRKTK